MKNKEEIEQLAEDQCNTMESKIGFAWGYKQCQEDMADYIFEVAFQFHRLGKYSGNTSDTHFTDIYEKTINSLNKQDNG